MATAKVSKRTVDAMEAPAAGKRTWLWDDQVRGFGVVMSASGRKVYVVQYRVGGKSNTAKRLTIGTHGSPWTPDAARERALELLRVVETGVDPAKAEQLAAAAEEAAARARREFGFGAFADRFIDKHVVAGQLRSRKDIEGTFDRDLRPWFGEQLVTEITNKDVKKMLAHVGERSRSAANKAYKWLSRMYTWGIQHDELESHPLVGLKRPFWKRDRRSQAVLVFPGTHAVIKLSSKGRLIVREMTGRHHDHGYDLARDAVLARAGRKPGRVPVVSPIGSLVTVLDIRSLSKTFEMAE